MNVDKIFKDNEHKVVVYKEVDGRGLRLYIKNPENFDSGEKFPAVVCIHGGGWEREAPFRMYPHINYFASVGAVGIAVEYRLWDSKINDIKTCLLDCIDALIYIREHAKDLKVDVDKITSFGDSAGSYMATALGSKKMVSLMKPEINDKLVNGVVDLNGIVDVSTYWNKGLNVDTERAKEDEKYFIDKVNETIKYSPIFNVSKGDAFVYTIHGLGDTVVDPKDSLKYYNALIKEGVKAKMKWLPKVNHAFILVDCGLDNESIYEILEDIKNTLQLEGLL